MPTQQIEFLLTRRPRLVAVARHRVSARIQSWTRQLDEDTKDTLDLLVSELVTNAVLHATGVMISVRVQLDGQRVRVEVEDDSPNPPPWRPGDDLATWEAEHGRGLQLISALASRHGWRPSSRGKRVWFELALPSRSPVRAKAALLGRAGRKVRQSIPWPRSIRPLTAQAA